MPFCHLSCSSWRLLPTNARRIYPKCQHANDLYLTFRIKIKVWNIINGLWSAFYMKGEYNTVIKFLVWIQILVLLGLHDLEYIFFSLVFSSVEMQMIIISKVIESILYYKGIMLDTQKAFNICYQTLFILLFLIQLLSQ